MLASSAKASMKAAGQQLPINNMTLGELSPKFIDTFSRDADQKPITIGGPEMEEISKTAFETAQMHKNNEAKKILIKGIMKQMREKNSKNLDISGYYKATPENSEGYEIRRGGDFASTYQMIEAAVVKRDLDRCKDPNVTLDELKALLKPENYVGRAPQQTEDFLGTTVKEALAEYEAMETETAEINI